MSFYMGEIGAPPGEPAWSTIAGYNARNFSLGPVACTIRLSVDSGVRYPINVSIHTGLLTRGGNSVTAYVNDYTQVVISSPTDNNVGGSLGDYEVKIEPIAELDAGGTIINRVVGRPSASIPLQVSITGSSGTEQRYEVSDGGQTWRVGDTISWNTTELSLRADPTYPWPAGQKVTDTLNVTVSIP